MSGQYYHVYNRGILKQPIFLEEKDYLRFIGGLYRFNDVRRGTKWPSSNSIPRKPLVSLLAWCLMPNHFHLFLRAISDDGVSAFMQRMGTGFTMFMNKKYERSGHLFQNVYQRKMLVHDAHFLHLSRYIHLNPLDLFTIDWPARGLTDIPAAERFLEQYRWSSYRDWLSHPTRPSIIDIEEVRSIVEGIGDYRSFMRAGLTRSDLGEV